MLVLPTFFVQVEWKIIIILWVQVDLDPKNDI